MIDTKGIKFTRKGSGWTIGLTVTGAYVECFERDGQRLIECNFYDGDNRDLEWTSQALTALMAAAVWQESGDIPGVDPVTGAVDHP